MLLVPSGEESFGKQVGAVDHVQGGSALGVLAKTGAFLGTAAGQNPGIREVAVRSSTPSGRIAGYGMNSARRPERDAIVRKAAAALIRYRDVETIGMSLGLSNVTVQRWALHYFPWYPADDYPEVDPQRWRDLLPRVRQLAQEPDSTSRGLAQSILFHYAGQREFLAQLVESETTAADLVGIEWRADRGDLVSSRVRRF